MTANIVGDMDKLGSLPAFIRIGNREVSFADFLLGCVAIADNLSGAAPGDPEVAVVQRAFLAAGCSALPDVRADRYWVQLGLGLDTPPDPGLYSELAGVAGALLDDATAVNLFFMHKPPGMRVRFQAAAGRQDELRARVSAMAKHWPVTGVQSGIYEAEAYLFGGSTSMDFVHQLFTADSLVWLELHRDRSDADHPASAWAVSLLLLRAVFDGLGITGWEDRGVWDLIRRETGRCLTSARQVSGFDRTAAELAALWMAPTRLEGLLPEWAREIVDRHREQALLIGARWRAGYFETDTACIGPRRCAAYYTIFHWNRARLSDVRQCLIVESLADPDSRGSCG